MNPVMITINSRFTTPWRACSFLSWRNSGHSHRRALFPIHSPPAFRARPESAPESASSAAYASRFSGVGMTANALVPASFNFALREFV